ncbi:hypothetical protein HS088_TW13G01128 [Tripterygium wilfordii]|uniref:Uncharacterized protein n=1 Tax=Tripterygium wilfordii TaxID=458696 RepID=A0A7J7CVT6_TRIWF|nr:hypothetical protein HS088_TW13G01128 [Tripterygium wilfordii]
MLLNSSNNTNSTSRMRSLCLRIMVLMMMLVFIHPGLVDCRVLQSAATSEGMETRVIDGKAGHRVASFSKPVKDMSGKVTVMKRVFTLASGPSKRGSGH